MIEACDPGLTASNGGDWTPTPVSSAAELDSTSFPHWGNQEGRGSEARLGPWMSRQELHSTGGNCQGDDRQESCSSAGNCQADEQGLGN